MSFSGDSLAPTFGAEALQSGPGAARAPESSVGEQSSAAAAVMGNGISNGITSVLSIVPW